MNNKDFIFKQFEKNNIPRGSYKYSDYEDCKRVIGMQSKLSVRVYNEFLKYAAEYVGT